MRKTSALLVAILFSLPAPLLYADIAAIHADKLPQETAVLAALDDARQLEPYCRVWTIKWEYSISKEDVSTLLGKDLGFLSMAFKNHPDNVELLLLTGLVARYAYNMDMEGSYEIAINTLAQAQKLRPSDFRVPWFRATLVCSTLEPKAGADEFLSIESSHAWDQLPAAFWNDYIECALVTNMPAHVLRAADHLRDLHVANSDRRPYLINIAHNRFDPFDPKKDYQPKEVWEAEKAGDDITFTSTTCGVRLRAHGNWGIENIGFANGSCIANFSTSSYKAVTGKLSPEVLVLVLQPKKNETPQDFAARFILKGTSEPFTPSQCPATSCIAIKGVQPGMYKENGDGHGRIVVFERDQPEFPGLIFEAPVELPKSTEGEGPKYYTPNQIQQRIPGKLYYLVLLDTAASIEEPALKDFDFFLQNLVVE